MKDSQLNKLWTIHIFSHKDKEKWDYNQQTNNHLRLKISHRLENKFIHQQQIERKSMMCLQLFREAQNMEKFTIKKQIMK